MDLMDDVCQVKAIDVLFITTNFTGAAAAGAPDDMPPNGDMIC